ncbi:MAG: hypothetical protein ACRC1G_13165 [Bradyrhizobium sp.]|nr:hypothetical protein [Bradyrhizobium sp.]
MTAIAQVLSRAFATTKDAESLKQIAIFSGAGLLGSLLLARGFDLGPFF